MHPIVIIGSGFASYQLVKTIRRQNTEQAIKIITADAGNDYNKPDLSHVFSREQSAQDLITIPAQDFVDQFNVELITETIVDEVNAEQHYVMANGQRHDYAKLVLATGAKTFVPPMRGNGLENVITLNSLQEYQEAESKLTGANKVLLIGGGLIGVEFAMDLASSGKDVVMVDPSSHVLSSMLPDFVAVKLEQQLREQNVQIDCLNTVTNIDAAETGMQIRTAKGSVYDVDQVVCVAGLKSNTQLASQIGLDVNRGIVVNSQLQTSHDDIYAIGDCAEINGKVMAFLQPIILSANTLAKNLLGEVAELKLSPMMVKVKTPTYPIQLSGSFTVDSKWQVTSSGEGIIARAYDAQDKMTAFVVTDTQVSQAFPLFRELQTA